MTPAKPATSRAIRDAVEPIALLGFTELEATIYAWLVQHSPATGYKVARAVGKPIANTYKAIEALQRKGAVLVDETGNRMVRALPPEDLLEQTEREFQRRHREARNALSRIDIPKPSPDAGVYALTSSEQVYDRCRKMLAKARAVALIDVYPGPLAVLKPAIQACARRGVNVAAQVYESVAITGVETVVHGQVDTVLEKWDGHWLNCVIDGAELLIAFLAPDGEPVNQAIWSRSPFLCTVFGSALGAELLASRLQRLVLEHRPDEEVREAIRKFSRYRAHELPGYRKLTAGGQAGRRTGGR
jgi:sugar-specific transcriptional regulator TrmB